MKVGGVEAVAVLVDEMLLVMGWVENGCVDGCMGLGWSPSRTFLGDDATSWGGIVVAQNTSIGIRRSRKIRCGDGCMSWRQLSSEHGDFQDLRTDNDQKHGLRKNVGV